MRSASRARGRSQGFPPSSVGLDRRPNGARLSSSKTGIGNRNTRQAYAQAVMRFMNWCDDRNLELADITLFTVTAYADEMTRE